MEVEVFIDSAHFPATVRKFTGNGMKVAFTNNWRPEEIVDLADIRILPTGNPPSREYKRGDTIEAALSQTTDGIIGWQLATIHEIRGNNYRVYTEYHTDDLEVVTKDRMRPNGIKYIKGCQFRWVEGFKFPVPEEVRPVFESSNQFASDFARAFHGMYVAFEGVFLTLAAATRNPLESAESCSLYFKELCTKLMYTRIAEAARSSEGVINVISIEDHVDWLYDDPKTEDEEMRNKLQFTFEFVQVPVQMADWVIGDNGADIQEFIDEHGVMTVKIANMENTGTTENARKAVPFQFIGTRESVENAKLLLERRILARKATAQKDRQGKQKSGSSISNSRSVFFNSCIPRAESEAAKTTPKAAKTTTTTTKTTKTTETTKAVSKEEKLKRNSEKSVDTSITADRFDDLSDQCCCSICSEVFDSSKFIPRSLACGHAFCEVCIYNDKMRINNKIKCPICQKVTDLPKKRVLPINYQLLSLVEMLMKSRADPKITCKACEVKSSPSSVRMCNEKDCDMFNQLLCLACVVDGQHGGHVVKYDFKMEKIRKEIREEVADLCCRVDLKKAKVLGKAKELAKITTTLEKNLPDAQIPAQVIGQFDTLASEQDAADYREIVNDLAKTLITGCDAVEQAFGHALDIAHQHFGNHC